MSDGSLSRLQRDILILEARTWTRPGEKFTEFRRRHPGVTQTGYDVALLRLLHDPRAYEYAGRRYAAMLTRLHRHHEAALERRLGLRTHITT